MTTDIPITLAQAAELYFPGTLTAATLRATAADGRLTVYRIGRRLYTTHAAMVAMIESCRVPSPNPQQQKWR